MYRPNICSYENLISIGNNTVILANSRIQLYPDLTKKKAYITIGNHCYIGYYLSILAGADIKIGNNVLIASNVLITSEGHGINPESDIPYMEQPLNIKEVIIEDHCWIGEKACILPGVTIGKYSVVAAGSIVTKSIPEYSIVAGNPAKVIKSYSFEKHQWVRV